jgi:hypothetical protein
MINDVQLATPVWMNINLVILMMSEVGSDRQNDLVEECLCSVCCLVYFRFWCGCNEQTTVIDTLHKDSHVFLLKS